MVRQLSFAFPILAVSAAWAIMPVALTRASDEHFEKYVRPILVNKCVECHSGMTPEGDLDLSSQAGFQAGGMGGPLVDPNDVPSSSLLARLITEDESELMPPDERLQPEEIEAIRQWIEGGAAWPEQSAVLSTDDTADDQHWSFVAPTKPPVPSVKNAAWCWNPIDNFLLEKMEAASIQPVGDASHGVWLRRVHLDLTGLPPTLEDQQALNGEWNRENDLRVIETLLASRAYAERQARHWLDLARYADTSGDGTDTPIPEARYYRDWVIDAFDNDMPYDQFLIEQLAGDILAQQTPDNPEAFRQVIATGYIALSRRFGNSKFAELHQIIDDTIDTVGKTTMGLSLGCARCHHHKFDPVTMDDYYGLYGYFASTQYPHAGTEHQKERSDMPELAVPENLREQFESNVAWAVSDKPETADAKIHLAGDPHRKGDVVARGYLGFINAEKPKLAAGESGRLELARWIASASNPLTARVMVNRIWQSHFGEGIVANASNFGRQTPEPLHSQLLDFLACEFVEQGWSVKHIHRLIVTSHAYRLASQLDNANDANAIAANSQDQANRLLWHFPRLRMDAETFRDSILAVSGQLELGSGGRHPFRPTEKIQYNQGNPFSEIFDHHRRSVYLMAPRLVRHPMMALFDAADANVTTAVRAESTVPLQALFLINGEFAEQQANALSERFENKSDQHERVDAMWHAVLCRDVSDIELQNACDFLESYRDAMVAEGCAVSDAGNRAWTSLAKSLLASNEFIYID